VQRLGPNLGWAGPGDEVTVEFAGQKKTAKADSTGKWRVKLDPLAASTEPRTLHVNHLAITDVLVGEVWVCSGQSNMEKPIGIHPGQRPCPNYEQEIAGANYPGIDCWKYHPRNQRTRSRT